ncbi:MAG: DUF58 domain-containing protein [Leptolyngbyaceae cyanobacterium]
MAIVPSRRFYGILLLIGGVIPGIAAIAPNLFNLTFSLQLLLGLDGLLIVVAIADGFLAKRLQVKVVRHRLERLSIGRDNRVKLTITPHAQTPITPAQVLQLYDDFPADIAAHPSQAGSNPSLMPLLVELSGTEPRTITYPVYPKQRGEVTWGDVYVRQRGPLALAWYSWRVPQRKKTSVYPDLIGLRALSIRLAIQSSGTIKQARRMMSGTEFAELRDYVAGDDPRLIDWNATARRGQPLVRVLEPEQEQTLIVLLDRGRLMTASVKGLARFDWGLNATLSLAMAGISRGDRVGVGVFDSTIHTWIPPNRGQPHIAHLLERLTPIQPVLLESDYFNAVSTLVTQQHRRALVVLITDIVDATASTELLSALARLRPRYLPFCVTLQDPYIQEQADGLEAKETKGIATAPNPTLESAYIRAVALDLLAQRQVAFARLRQKGVMVLDAPVNQISEQLVDQYLRLKARNQL